MAAGLTTDPGFRDPELMTRLSTSQAKVEAQGSLLLGRHGELRFSSYHCDRLFTWPADQPRHAVCTSVSKVETWSPPFGGRTALPSFRWKHRSH